MAATKNQKNDPSRFEGNGTNFRAKLIGVDNVEEARGDKICQVSMQKLKALVKASGEHKQKIVVNVSLEGLKIIDGVSLAVLYTHPVHRISFIARDMSDNRAFGYIFGAGDGTHQFFAIKTEKAAENLVLTLRDLFEVVYDMKKKEMEEAKKKQEESTTENGETGSGEKDGQKPGEEGQESIYQVPHNNAPVNPESEKSESNLLDLEDQLESIELGIQQMSSFDSLVGGASAGGQTTTDPWGTPVSSAASSSGSGLSDLQGLQSGFAAPSPFQQPGFGAAAPFGAARPAVPGMTAPAGNPFAPQVGVPPNTVRTPFPAASAGFGTAPPAAFPQPTPGVQPGFGTPATSFGQPAAAFPAVPAAVPIPGASPFPGVPPQTGPVQANFAGFPEEDPNILAPVVIGKEEAPAEPKPEKEKKDAFSDLVAIGTTTDVRKTPKDMFAELNAPPKKTLIELQMEKNSALTPGTASPNRSPSPLIVPQTSPFGDPFAAPGEDPLYAQVKKNVPKDNSLI